MSTVRIIQPGFTYEYPPLFTHKKDPLTLTSPCYEKMYMDYAGLSPLLCKELVYRETRNENIETLINNAIHSDYIYINTNNQKEDYHLLMVNKLVKNTHELTKKYNLTPIKQSAYLQRRYMQWGYTKKYNI